MTVCGAVIGHLASSHSSPSTLSAYLSSATWPSGELVRCGPPGRDPLQWTGLDVRILDRCIYFDDLMFKISTTPLVTDLCEDVLDMCETFLVGVLL